MFRSARRVFGLVVVELEIGDDLDHAERLIAHDGAGQLLAGNVAFDDQALAIGPVFAGQFLRGMSVINRNDKNSYA